MPESGQERTERASPKRRQDARKRGQVPRSAELPGAAALLAGIMTLRVTGPMMWGSLEGLVRDDLASVARADLTPGESVLLFGQSIMTAALAVTPILISLLVTGVVAGLLQTGLVVAPLKPHFERLNPATGMKRIFSISSGFELGKMILRLVVLVAVAASVFGDIAHQVGTLNMPSLSSAPGVMGDILFTLAVRVAIAGVILAVVDYGFQRWRFERDLKMTKQEVREEMKQLDGNPEVKSRIRRLQRALAKKRMMNEVPKSTVVVTNPTHFAVALRYESGKMRAPIVVAKGQDLVAQQIKAIARKHDVPVLENPPLARALHAGVPLGKQIPPQLYRAVAEVLAFVFKLRRRW
jgi:flagellar biosynthesis protein FlhB